MSVLGSVSSILRDDGKQVPQQIDPSPTQGGEAEPSTSMSPELRDVFMAAQYAWASRYAPHLLKEWLND